MGGPGWDVGSIREIKRDPSVDESLSFILVSCFSDGQLMGELCLSDLHLTEQLIPQNP